MVLLSRATVSAPVAAAIAIVAALATHTAARALPQSNQEIVLQFYVTNADGTPVDGIFETTISIWDAETGGIPLWSEVQNLIVADGVVSTVLGFDRPLPPEIFDGGTRYVDVSFPFLPAQTRKPLVSASVQAGADGSLGFAFDTVEVTVVFDEVTVAGTASATYSNEAPPLPEGFNAGDAPAYLDVSTTAVFTGAVTVCLSTSPESYSNPDNLYLLHYEDGAWIDLTPLVPYEATLVDAEGHPLEGDVMVHFVVYDDPGLRNALWEDFVTEPVIAGDYRTSLGSGVPLPREFFDGTVRYLGIAADNGAEQLPLSPFAPAAMCGQVSSLSPFVVAERKAIAVDIDILPGSSRNPVNPRSQGTIPVAILSSAQLDAPGQIMVPSLTFGRTGEEQSLAGCARGGVDVNRDGLPDLVCRFFTQRTGFGAGDVQGFLRASALGGTRINGADVITIVGR